MGTADLVAFLTTEEGVTDGAGRAGDGGTGLAAKERALAYTYIALGTLGLLGNIFVIIVIACYKKMLQLVTNIYILNQSLIDAVCSLILILTYIFNNEGSKRMQGILGELTCRIWVSTAPLWAMMVSSSGNLLAVTIERYLAVSRPIWHKTSFTRGRALWSLPVIWLYGPVLNGAYTLTPHKVRDGQCYVFTEWVSETWHKVGGVYLFILHIVLPVLVFTFCYGRMALLMRSKVTASSDLDPKRDTGGRSRKLYNNIVRMLGLVVVCYVCCWGINQFYFLLFNLGHDIDFSSNFFHFSVFMTFLNCCINPFIYAAKYKQFQEGVRHLFGLKHKSDLESNQSTTQQTHIKN